MDDDSGFGISHLSEHPITVSFGVVLLGILVLLIILRLLFADVSVAARGGAR